MKPKFKPKKNIKNIPSVKSVKNKAKKALTGTIASVAVLAVAYIFGDDINVFNNNDSVATKGLSCKITSVHDGDSMRVQCPGDKKTIAVRLEQIDAPETDQAYGLKSRDYLRALCVRGKQAVLNNTETDMYGRTLARVHCNGIDVNAEMVKTGNAWVYEYYAKDENLFDLQKDAQKQKLGLWDTNKKPIAPWDFRRNKKKPKG